MADERQAIVNALRDDEDEYTKEMREIKKARDQNTLKVPDSPEKKLGAYGPGAIGSIRETIGNAMDTVFKSKKQKQMEEDLSKP